MAVDIIFDIDGTLMDVEHRVHFLQQEPKDWESFNQNMINDTPIPEMSELLKTLIREGSHRIIFCSGRNEDSREVSEKQITDIVGKELGDFLPTSDTKINLYMRSENDYRPDHEVKSALLDQMRIDGFDPKLVFDDRASVVKMWRVRGLRCLQVDEGNF